MTELRSAAQEAAEDIYFGQVAIIWARWFVIISGVIVVLWSSNTTSELTAAVLMVVSLIAINFFVRGRSFAHQSSYVGNIKSRMYSS